MDIQFTKILYLIALLALIFGIMISQENYSSNCRFPDCTASKHIPKFRTLVKDFNCSKSAKIPNALDNTNRFTISAILDVSNYNSKPEWQRLFHAGNPDASKRTPGVWINTGHLHVRASTTRNWNDGQGCLKITPQLDRSTHYHLVLVYDDNRIDVYLDGRKIQSCPTSGKIVPQRDLYLGKWRHENEGANINMTLTYLPVALNERDIQTCWLYIKDFIKQPMKLAKTSNCRYSKTNCPNSVFFQNCQGQFLTAPKPGVPTVFTSSASGTNSCFRLVNPIFNARQKGNFCSVESVKYPGHFLRHAGYITYIHPKIVAKNQHVKEDFVFEMVPGVNNQPDTITLKAIQPQFKGGCFYFDGKHLRFKPRHCPNTQSFKDSASLHMGLAFNRVKLSNPVGLPQPKPKPIPKPINDAVTIYQHNNFAGRSKSFPIGQFNLNQLGIGNDQLSSIRVKPGYRATLYEHSNFRGKTLTLTGNTTGMPRGWNDQTSSIAVTKI